MGLLSEAAGIRTPTPGRVALHVQLAHTDRRIGPSGVPRHPYTWEDTVQCIDLGNCEKVLSNALNGIAWADDKQLRRIVLERMEPD